MVYKIWFGQGMLFVLFILTTACTVSIDNFWQQVGNNGNEDSPVGCSTKIGIIVPQSGVDRDGGQEHLRGYEIAQDEINAKGGVLGCQLALDIVDDQSNPARAQQAVQELADRGLPILIGAYSSGGTLSAAEEANRLKIPLIVPTASSDLITQLGYTWVFRINSPSTGYVRQAIAFTSEVLVEPGEVPRIAVIYENTPFGESAAVAMTQEAEAEGLVIVAYERYTPGDEDFSGQLENVQDANPDMVYLVSNDRADGLNLLIQSDKLHFTPKAFIANAGAYIQQQFLQDSVVNGKNYAENLIVTTQWSEDVTWQDEENRTAADFVATFAEQYDNAQPSMRSVATYAALYLAVSALERGVGNGTINESNIDTVRSNIQDALKATDLENSLYGPINFDSQGQNAHPVLLVQVQNGAFKTIYPANYSLTQPVIPAP